MLYIPNNVPFPDAKNPQYIRAVADEVEILVKATHGHTLVLFTSYKVMELVFHSVSEKIHQYPKYKMSKKTINPIDIFKQSKNGVLFASGNCWEGIDIPGDILSSLIIVKLPFAVPDPISEYEQTLYDSVLKALPECRLTESVIDVERFIRTKKSEYYFNT